MAGARSSMKITTHYLGQKEAAGKARPEMRCAAGETWLAGKLGGRLSANRRSAYHQSALYTRFHQIAWRLRRTEGKLK